MRIRTVQRQQAPPPPRHRGRAAATVALRLLIGAAAIWALLSVIGLVLTHIFGTGPVHSADLGVDRWFLHRRSAPWNSVMLFGTDLARTETVVGVAVVAAAFFRWRLRRWRESLIVVAVVAGEVLIFLAVTLTVPQRRPPVPKLQAVPPTSSYPSGHTAAAVALYGCIAVVILANWAARHPSVRVAAALLFCIPVYVGVSRLYEGEHYPSDVLAGALLGSLWLLCVLPMLKPRTRQAAVPVGRANLVPQ